MNEPRRLTANQLESQKLSFLHPLCGVCRKNKWECADDLHWVSGKLKLEWDAYREWKDKQPELDHL